MKKGREEEGEDRIEEGKGESTRPFLAREPNSSTSSTYEPASQALEKENNYIDQIWIYSIGLEHIIGEKN